ncbi:MAG: hypothetical protein Q4D87_07245 [Actinomycetaceae bacterium]|nr:hypothetical protein [Actinomycetaceae bacterium]
METQNAGKTKAIQAVAARRETHSSRALTAVVLAVIGIILSLYLVAETIASISGAGNLLAPAADIWHAVLHAPRVLPNWALLVGGVASIVLALILIWKALAPGTLNRHSIADDRAAVVVDDGVIAAGVSRAVRDRFALQQAQVSTSVSRRHVRVTITPMSGVDLDYAAIEKFVAETVANYRLIPRVSISLKRSDGGVIAA